MIHVQPTDVDDKLPTEAEIAFAVMHLLNGISPGLTKMQAEHLKQWRREAIDETSPDPCRWDMLVRLRHVYEMGEIPQSLTYLICVLLPKDDGGHQGIGLLKVVWTVIVGILNAHCHAIKLHDSLHATVRCGTGTAIFEAKLFQQLALAEQVPVFEIFLDLKKAYDTAD